MPDNPDSKRLICLFYLIITLTAALFSLPRGKLSDRGSGKNIMYLAFFFWVAIYFSFINLS
jgi:hypothetical protein